MVKTLPLSEVKTHLSELVDEVANADGRVLITKHGRPAALLIGPDDLEGLEETLEIMSNREFMADIRRAIEEVDSGKARMISLDELDANFEFKRKRRPRRSRSGG